MGSTNELDNYKKDIKDLNKVKVTTASVKLVIDVSEETQAQLSKLSIASDKADDFFRNQRLLANLSIVNKDENIKTVYAANKMVIDKYGTSSNEYYHTGYIFSTLVAYCLGESSTKTNKITLDQYNLEIKFCKDFLDSNETVPSKSFNDSIYVPYRKFILQAIKSTQVILSTTSIVEYNQALASLEDATNELGAIDTSKIQDIRPSHSPKSQLQRIKDKVIDRKAVFFR
ncbi:MAG: hypothetical protein WAW80_05330 [Candidatus Saccharimonadales bacterium]